MNTKDLPLKRSNFYLFKGDPGASKSISGTSFPECYIFDLDKRIRSVASFWKNRNYDYDQFDSFESIQTKLEKLLSSCPYQSILYDGLTSTAEILIRDMIDARPVNPKTTRAGVRMTEIEDFGGEQRGLDYIINQLIKIRTKHDVDVIVTAHVIEIEKQLRNGATIKVRSLLTAGKKVAAFLPIHFDERYHFQVNEPVEIGGISRYEVITRHTGEDWASTTYNIPPRIDITNKSFYQELQRLREEGGDFDDLKKQSDQQIKI